MSEKTSKKDFIKIVIYSVILTILLGSTVVILFPINRFPDCGMRVGEISCFCPFEEQIETSSNMILEDTVIFIRITNLTINESYIIVKISVPGGDLISREDILKEEIISFNASKSEFIFATRAKYQSGYPYDYYRLYYDQKLVFLDDFLAFVELHWKS